MSETDKKAKTAQDAAGEVRKQLKAELEKIRSLTKKEYSPKETFDKLTDSIKQQITQYQDSLVKLSKAEAGTSPKLSGKEVMEDFNRIKREDDLKADKQIAEYEKSKNKTKLNKTLHGLPSKTPTNTQVMHDALNKTVFGMIKREMEMVQPSHKHTDPKSPGAVLPNDKLPPEVKHDPTAHKVKGGKKLKKDAESMQKAGGMPPPMGPSGHPIIQNIPKLKPQGLANLMEGKAELVGDTSGPNGTSIGRASVNLPPTVSARAPSPILEPTIASPGKTVSMKGALSPILNRPAMKAEPSLAKVTPHLGGKDPVSQDMTSHAMTSAAKDAKNAQMPTQQQVKAKPLDRIGTPGNIDRQRTFAQHMPKGPFNKSETKSCEECQSVLPNGHNDRICKGCMMKNERT